MKIKLFCVISISLAILSSGCNKDSTVNKAQKPGTTAQIETSSSPQASTDPTVSTTPNATIIPMATPKSTTEPLSMDKNGAISASPRSKEPTSPTINNPTKVTAAKPKASGEKFPDFSTKDFDGKSVDNSVFAKSKVTLVNYWATWCGPCRTELPELQALHQEIQAKGGAVMGLVSDATQTKGLEAGKKLVSQNQLKYPNLVSTPGIESFVSARSQYVPTSFLIDKDGYIIGKSIIGSKSKADYLKLINDALGNL